MTIYLINSEYQNETDMLNSEKPTSKQEIVGIGNLYYLHSNISEPSWLDSFFGNTIDKKPFRNATSKAVLLIPVQVDENNKRYFAITFGYGASLLNKSAIEERFGLKTVLNSVSANSIRRIAMTEVAGNARKSNEQMPKQSTISDFSLDIERDLLNGITAVSDKKNSTFSGMTITGTDSLNVSTNRDVSSIREFLLDIYKVYSQDTYKNNFPWIDHIAPVKDKTLKDKLDSKLIEIINAKEETIWMAVPSVIEWENIQGFKYHGDRNTYPDILIEKVLDSFKKPLMHADQLRKKNISVISNLNDEKTDGWTAYKCLYGDIKLDDSQYCINSGEWYKVDADYVKKINEDYSATSVSDIPFPYFQVGENEKDYNKRLANSNATEFILMDREIIKHGGASSGFELCDVLSRNGKFIHVKQYSSSATLSHLFNQGLTTAELVKSDKDFVAKANNQIAKQCTGKQDFTLTQNHPQVVVFAIISNKHDKIPNIPFFSKITFCNIKKRLEMMGINVEIRFVNRKQ
ncbi:MAG: TIGR04141 family sporadically distributed protein [Neisseriaceae bacterium]|nr:TIGR04141 family sporadically distributed protein [Neisseriaceae bacterium]